MRMRPCGVRDQRVRVRSTRSNSPTGRSGPNGAVPLQARAELLAAQAKLFAANAGWDAADRAVQIFGGRGWSTLYRVGRHLMDVRVCRIYEGTDEILKLKVAAAVLGKEYEAYK